jgi:hypothetical protein
MIYPYQVYNEKVRALTQYQYRVFCRWLEQSIHGDTTLYYMSICDNGILREPTPQENELLQMVDFFASLPEPRAFRHRG